ncbi:hypothetical protein HWV62_6765, partial [Athelia sp. TMB]
PEVAGAWLAELSPPSLDEIRQQDANMDDEDTQLDVSTEASSHFEDPDIRSPTQLPSTSEANFVGRSLAQFLTLKNHRILAESTDSATPAAPADITPVPVIGEEEIPDLYVAPASILDRNTLILPSPWRIPSSVHRYLASVDFAQKRSIISALTNHECSVELTERETLDGVDIIIDPHTAIIFASLGSLPSQGETLSQRLGELSWRYSRLLVILEAFSSSAAYKRYKPRSLVNPYTAPGLRAIQKLRRSFAIMDGCGSKRSGTSIHLAFADTVEQAAMFTRCFGDCSEANDTTGGVIWGSRKWLDSEEQEDERELGRFPGMNMFSALTLICQMPLHVFLDLSTPERTSVLEQLIGYDRAMAFNEELESRYHDMRDVTSSSNKDDS